MKKVLVIITAFLLFSISAYAADSGSIDIETVLDHIDDMYRSTSSQGKVTMKIVTEHWERELSMDIWSMGEDKSLIRILSPKKEKGTATLRIDNEIWNYLPKVDRVIKLPSSMMSDSWMGSHFTNDDLVKESRMADDYAYEFGKKTEDDANTTVVIDCIPRENAAVVWGKITVRADLSTMIPLQIDYYDEDMNLARTMTFTDVREMGGRRIPAKMKIQPADKPDEHTAVMYDDMEFNIDIDDSMFSIRSLKK